MTITTNDGKVFTVEGKIARLSGLIETTLQDASETEIPMPDVEGEVF